MTVAAALQDALPDVLSVEPLPTMERVGDFDAPQFRYVMRVRDPQAVWKYAQSAPPGVVVIYLCDAKVRP